MQHLILSEEINKNKTELRFIIGVSDIFSPVGGTLDTLHNFSILSLRYFHVVCNVWLVCNVDYPHRLIFFSCILKLDKIKGGGGFQRR